jgi:hypothetical protein
MASVGFEPDNLDTKGQHATSRPPKPRQSLCYTLWKLLVRNYQFWFGGWVGFRVKFAFSCCQFLMRGHCQTQKDKTVPVSACYGLFYR